MSSKNAYKEERLVNATELNNNSKLIMAHILEGYIFKLLDIFEFLHVSFTCQVHCIW